MFRMLGCVYHTDRTGGYDMVLEGIREINMYEEDNDGIKCSDWGKKKGGGVGVGKCQVAHAWMCVYANVHGVGHTNVCMQ